MKCKKCVKVLSVFSVIFFIVTLASCRYIFADPESERAQESDGIEIIIPALPSQSGGAGSPSASDTWSVYALLCDETVDLSDSLLKTMLVDEGTPTGGDEFVNAHERDGILAQQSFIDVNEPISISFPKIVAGTNFFVRIVIVKDGKIEYTGTSPDRLIGADAGGVYSIDRSRLHVAENGQNVVHVILRKIKSIAYYVSSSGDPGVVLKSTKSEPTTIDAALTAVASEQQAADIIFVDDVELKQGELLKNALENAGDIALSSLAGSTHTFTVSGSIEIPSSTELACENIHIAGSLTLAKNSRLLLVDAECTSIIATESDVTVSGTSTVRDVEVDGGKLMLSDDASVTTLIADSATVTRTGAVHTGGINLKGNAIFNGNIQTGARVALEGSSRVNGTITALTGGNVMLAENTMATSISATSANVTLGANAKITGNLDAKDTEVIVGDSASVGGNITLSGNAKFTASNTITVKAGTSLSLSDAAKLIVPAGETITVQGGTIKLGGSPTICDVSNKSVPIVLDETTGTWGHIAVTAALSRPDLIPVTVRNTESAYAPFATAPVLEYAAGIAANHEQFKWEFDRPGVWDFVSQPQGSTTVVYIKTVSQPVWLFNINQNNTNDRCATFYYGSTICSGGIPGSSYRLSKDAIFSTAAEKIFIYGQMLSDNSHRIFLPKSGSFDTFAINGEIYDLDAATASSVYAIYAGTNDASYTAKKKLMLNHIAITGQNAQGKAQYEETQYTIPTGIANNLTAELSGTTVYYSLLCVHENTAYFLNRLEEANAATTAYKATIPTSGNLIYNNRTDAIALPTISGDVNNWCNDMIYFNGALWILMTQDSGTYHRGGIIKVPAIGNSEKYGVPQGPATNETNDKTCFYDPIRFLGVDGSNLIIADYSYKKTTAQKNRVVYFNTSSNSIERICYTDAEFLGVR
ncbi:MAG: hypothetical protein IJR50_03905 [Treponema sp.]|nr:hypothetical protein [Treponema sp.]